MDWAKHASRLRFSSCPSPGSIKKQLGLADSEAVLDYVQERIGSVRPDSDVIETRIRCWAWRSRGWQVTTVGDWRAGRTRCDCKTCDGQPAIAEAAPELGDRMLTHAPMEDWRRWLPDPTQVPVTAWWPFLCPNAASVDDESHDVITTSAAILMRDGWTCKRCWQHADRAPGEILEDWREPSGEPGLPGLRRKKVGPATTHTEQHVVAALKHALPDIVILDDVRILLRRNTTYPVAAIKPDAVLPELKLAIEIDGGTGNSPGYSAHDTPAGQHSDELRDNELHHVGWQVIRVRHKNALPLTSPATIVTYAPTTQATAETLCGEIRRRAALPAERETPAAP